MAIDGLKVEPLPPELTGLGGGGWTPVRDFPALVKPLSERPLAGFGGTLTVEDAWTFGFDHICIAVGAGKPTFVRMKNNLIRGIRKASDFLMALQLTGAGKRDSMANLQIRLRAVVIGGGLTAIDAATELMAYYPVQVEKVKHRYNSAEHTGIVSINFPMQCMMKAICAQCLQRHVDPATGKEEFVFSCVNQDQSMDEVDFANLKARLRANSVLEKITNRWLDLLLEGNSLSLQDGFPQPASPHPSRRS